MDNWHKFRQLSRLEHWLLLQALLLLPLTALGLRWLGFKRVQSALAGLSPTGDKSAGDEVLMQAYTTAKMVKIGARYGLYHTCR
jgi:hypothetical protein